MGESLLHGGPLTMEYSPQGGPLGFQFSIILKDFKAKEFFKQAFNLQN